MPSTKSSVKAKAAAAGRKRGLGEASVECIMF